MDALILRNVRCFREPAPIPLAPLTVLVGENSTGKTTLLAAIRLAWRLARSVQTPDFNEEPFPLGAYEQIANFRGGRGGRADAFEVGFEAELGEMPASERRSKQQQLPFAESEQLPENQLQLVGRFENRASQPALVKWKVASGRFAFEIQPPAPDNPPVLNLTYPDGKAETRVGMPFPMDVEDLRMFLGAIARFPKEIDAKRLMQVEGESPDDVVFGFVESLTQRVVAENPKALYASAPIRTQPKRTYEPLKDAFEPQGGHVPMILAKSYQEDRWKPIVDALDRFGKASGLFEHLNVA